MAKKYVSVTFETNVPYTVDALEKLFDATSAAQWENWRPDRLDVWSFLRNTFRPVFKEKWIEAIHPDTIVTYGEGSALEGERGLAIHDFPYGDPLARERWKSARRIVFPFSLSFSPRTEYSAELSVTALEGERLWAQIWVFRPAVYETDGEWACDHIRNSVRYDVERVYNQWGLTEDERYDAHDERWISFDDIVGWDNDTVVTGHAWRHKDEGEYVGDFNRACLLNVAKHWCRALPPKQLTLDDRLVEVLRDSERHSGFDLSDLAARPYLVEDSSHS